MSTLVDYPQKRKNIKEKLTSLNVQTMNFKVFDKVIMNEYLIVYQCRKTAVVALSYIIKTDWGNFHPCINPHNLLVSWFSDFKLWIILIITIQSVDQFPFACLIDSRIEHTNTRKPTRSDYPNYRGLFNSLPVKWLVQQ